MTGVFLDTNVLVYAFSGDPKAARAESFMGRPFVVGVQTLNEFSSVAKRKLGMDWHGVAVASSEIVMLAERVLDTTLPDIQTSIALAERYKVQLFDPLMLAIALRAGSTFFYSEDMHHGMVIEDRMTILNPFR